MLEKQENNILAKKLRANLLIEADFNTLNKIIFNTQLIPTLEVKQLIPKEIIGGRRG